MSFVDVGQQIDASLQNMSCTDCKQEALAFSFNMFASLTWQPINVHTSYMHTFRVCLVEHAHTLSQGKCQGIVLCFFDLGRVIHHHQGRFPCCFDVGPPPPTGHSAWAKRCILSTFSASSKQPASLKLSITIL
eukprot:c28897_g1_i1 orf=80-478(-)